jgi:molybdopterin converting factor subunit 1
MKIRLLAFASAAEALGAAETSWPFTAGQTVRDLRDQLEERHPALRPLGSRMAIAVDGSLASADTPLTEGAEVALLPPVSGG